MAIEMRQMQSQMINLGGPCLSAILYGVRRVGNCIGSLKDKTYYSIHRVSNNNNITITLIHHSETQWET
jgi:hypothetical protein